MSTTVYLTSGLLERFAVGLASPEEIVELEEMATQYPEIQEELRAIRRALQGYVLAHQVAPPDGLREQLVSNEKAMPSRAAAPPKRATEAAPAAPRYSSSSSNNDGPGRPVNYIAITAVLLGLALAGAAFTAMTFFNDAEKRKADVTAVKAQVEVLEKEKAALLDQQALLNDQVGLLRDRSVEPIRLRGTVKAPEARATIYWNGPKKISHIDVQRLPEVPQSQKLQLWVVVNRSPKLIGDIAENGLEILQSLTFFENPEAYYVTLEDAAVSAERPNLRQVMMYVRVER